MNNEYNNGETIQIWNYAERFEVTTSSSAASIQLRLLVSVLWENLDQKDILCIIKYD